MDDIKIPLKKGSLNNIDASTATSNQADEEMEVDGSSQVCNVPSYMLSTSRYD